MAKSGALYGAIEGVKNQAAAIFSDFEGDDDIDTVVTNLNILIEQAVLLRDVATEVNVELAKL